MENSVKKVQVETTYEVDYNGECYTVVHSEDIDPNSGYSSWDIFDDVSELLHDSQFESEIIEFMLDNI